VSDQFCRGSTFILFTSDRFDLFHSVKATGQPVLQHGTIKVILFASFASYELCRTRSSCHRIDLADRFNRYDTSG
jgi:hypothetical protein